MLQQLGKFLHFSWTSPPLSASMPKAPSSSGLLKPKEEIVSDAVPIHEAETLPADSWIEMGGI